MGEWKDFKIGDILLLEYGKSLKNYHNGIGKYDVFGTNGKIGKTDTFLFDEPSLIIGRKGAYREVHFANKPFFVIDTAFYTKNKIEGLDTIFLYYWFKNIDINLMDSGSAIPSTSRDEVYDLDIRLPSSLEQTAIASILSSLDDKIDLLHRQNATFEKMAETLFKQWFVEEAKEEWEMVRISDYAIHFKESIQPQKNKSTLYAHYSIPSYDNGKNPVKELGGEIQSNKYKIPNYCILFSKLNPHKDKRVWLLQDEVESNGICSTEFQVVLPKKKQHLYFLYGWLTLNENYNELASGVGGTSGSHQRIDPSNIYDFQCPLLTDDAIERYNIQIEPIFKKQVVNHSQIPTLTALRDTLLPKLMSGEVRVEMNLKEYGR